ncbi:hypothetical protein IWQ60_002351 [Tieghemiomyces parasiticus]|uniref:Sepiapterin reductase n=1 Tax=Tieghemiomyces parasiticus TaxID=78921 RepID=A0A9W8ACF1_9FUNG|nr:hypothetical protein IWQ60_002351 [Tieghemiomyces parasiticus]
MAVPVRDLCIIVGASSGFGRALAQTFAERFCAQTPAERRLHLVLVGRRQADLQTTSDACQPTSPARVDLTPVAEVDLANLDALDANVDRVLDTVTTNCCTLTDAVSPGPARYARATLILNAGTLGGVTLPVRDRSWRELRTFFDVNFVAYTAFFTAFLKRVDRGVCSDHRTVVNVSSLLAVKAFPSWGAYAPAKAARHMFAQVAAAEEDPAYTKVLSYSPGPLANDMQRTVRETLGDPEQKLLYTNMFDKGDLVSMEDSARKAVDLILDNTFTSGCHIDYYD